MILERSSNDPKLMILRPNSKDLPFSKENQVKNIGQLIPIIFYVIRRGSMCHPAKILEYTSCVFTMTTLMQDTLGENEPNNF
jgi:hypothetical protein